MKLLFEAITKFTLGLILVGLLLFIPAGSFAYRQGIILIVALFAPMFLAGLAMLLKKPELLKKRLNNKEKEKEQKMVVVLSAIMFICGFVAAGLSYRFDFLMVPEWASYTGVFVLVSSYIIYVEVMRENKYLSRTVEVQENQVVISTGLYGMVRHPMYSATIFLFLSMPIVLGSLYAFLIFLVYPQLIAKRIRSEEKLLEEELPGYKEYLQKVKYRLIPFIW